MEDEGVLRLSTYSRHCVWEIGCVRYVMHAEVEIATGSGTIRYWQFGKVRGGIMLT